MLRWTFLGLLALLAVWLLAVAVLILAGRRTQAHALARLVPDCLVALARLARDPRLARRDRVAIVLVLGYLALPFDLIPDVIPVAGQLDDAIVVALLVRRLRRAGAGELLREQWSGPAATLEWLLGRPAAAAPATRELEPEADPADRI